MARLYLFAEGQTEQTFADTVIKAHLANFGVYMHNLVLVAHTRKRRKVHRGGGRKYLPMKNDIVRFLKQESTGEVFFTTMIDLYALHADFPGRDEAEKLRNDPYKRVEHLEKSWSEDILDSRFIPFIQLHEFEAYLFANIARIESHFAHASAKTARLQIICDAAKGPELIDDGPSTAPSKRIIGEFPEYEDAKSTIGPQIAQKIGLHQIRARCPHFDEWLARLEQLDAK